MADNMEEVNVSGKKCRKWLRTPSFSNILKFFVTLIAHLDPETIQLPAFYTLSAMFTGACGPPENPSLTLVLRLNVLRMNVKLTYRKHNVFTRKLTH